MTKTCDGAGAALGAGEGLSGGVVRIGGDDVGLAWSWAEGVWLQAASTASAMKLSAARWEMAIRPERGGRITSLRLDEEELLDQGIGVDQPNAEGFVEGGAWGWDEMVPNLEPTDTLPDHGEAWRMPWTVTEQSGDSVVMTCRGQLVPWSLERRVALGRDVEVAYRYMNAGSRPHHAFWCAHPLFKFEPGMAAVEEGRSAKVFLPRASVDRMALRWRSGAAIEMRWDPTLTPNVAIWACNGDLGGYRQIAIEPSTDSPLLAPGAEYRWWLQIRAL